MRRLTQEQKDGILQIMMEGAVNELAAQEENAEFLDGGFSLHGLTADEVAEAMAHWFYKCRLPKSDVWNSGLPRVWDAE